MGHKSPLTLIQGDISGDFRGLRGQVVCALDYEAGDPGSIPGSCGTTDWLFRAGW